MTFGQPSWLWVFALLPVLIALFFRNERQRRGLVRKLVAARLESRLAGNVSRAKRRGRFVLLLLGMSCVILALAQPQWGYTWEQSKRKGRDVLIAIDTSRSMLATDIAPNRLTRAKLAAQDLIHQLAGDRVGLIAFAGTAFLQAPLTVDFTAVESALHELDTEIIPQGGSNIAAAIRTAREAFGKGESEHRALIVFSDGEEFDADGQKTAEELKGAVLIYSIGLGSPDGSLIPVPGERGGTEFVKDAQGQIVKSRLDEERLRKIAEATGGFYVRFQSGRAEIDQIVRDGLGKMTEHDIDAKLSRRPIERYQWPLGAGLVLLASSMLIRERRASPGGRASPRAGSSANARRRLARTLALPVALLISTSAVFARNSGVEAYERKDYKGAIGEFSNQLKRQPQSPALHFNLGSAAYKNGDMEKALESFSKAVTSTEPELRALAEYNLGNTLFQRGAAQKGKEPKLQEWKNALQHYEQALAVDPKSKDAEHNRDVVRKLIEELSKEPPKSDEQQKQDQQQQQKQDQPKDEQQPQQGQGKGEKEDSQQSNSKDQSPQGQSGEQPNAGKEGESKEQQPQGSQEQEEKKSRGQQDEKMQDGKGDQQPQPVPEQPEKKPEGELKSAPQFGEQGEQKDAAERQAAEALAEAEGKMSETQAKNLIESLRSEDRRVQLIDPRERKTERRVLRDW